MKKMTTGPDLKRFEDGLKSKNSDTRRLAAQELYHYVKIELNDNGADHMSGFLDEFNQLIFELVSSNDNNERKGGILAMDCLICADICNINTRLSRFANYLRNLIPDNDNGVMEFAARTVGKLAAASGSTSSSQYVEFELKRAFEWLSSDRNETKRYAATLILKELAINTPTNFNQHIETFFELIFKAIGDQKQCIREMGARALKAALIVTGKRETISQQQTPQWYKHCYHEITKLLEDRSNLREDRIHGALLALNELLRCSNAKWESKFNKAMKYVEMDVQLREFDYLKVLYPQTKKSFVKNVLESIQTVRFDPDAKIVSESIFCRQLIRECYDSICNETLSQRSSKLSIIQQAILSILPRLAAFETELFVHNYLNLVINYLLSLINNREKEKRFTYVTIGLIALATEEYMRPYVSKLDDIIQVTSSRTLDKSYFIFIIFLLKALKSKFRSEIENIIEHILSTNFNKFLVLLLRTIIEEIPELKLKITDSLFRILSLILLQKHIYHSEVLRFSPIHDPYTINLMDENADNVQINLALKALRSFDFDNVNMFDFINKCANCYFNNCDSEIRLNGVKTCIFLLEKSLKSTSKYRNNSFQVIVFDTLTKLLSVSLSDKEKNIRFTVFTLLSTTFDLYLSQSDAIDSIMIASNDEVLEIRELATCLLGRVSNINPAYTLPLLRKTFLKILVDLEYMEAGRSKEHATKMLDHLVVNAPQFVTPYAETIIRILMTKLKSNESSTSVTLELLQIIGDLATVIGDSPFLMDVMPQLLEVVFELLNDSASAEKRAVAIWILGRLDSAVGHQFNPYDHHPSLLDILINFLKTEQQSITRREIIRVLGLIGAIDPYYHKIHSGLIDPQQQSIVSMSVCETEDKDSFVNLSLTANEMLVNMNAASLEEYYPAVALAVLMRIIKDSTLYQHHTLVIQAITFIFKSLNIKCVPYISQVVPHFLYVVRNADMTYKEFLFQQLATLVCIVKYHMRKYLDEIFDIISDHWVVNGPLQSTVILLIEHIAQALGYVFKPFIPRIMNNILSLLSDDCSKDKSVTVKMLIALQKFGNTLDDYVHLIVTPIVALFEIKNCPLIVPRTALETIEYLSYCVDLRDFASKIIHPLTRVMNTSPELIPVAMNTLVALVSQLGKRYSLFMPLVQATLDKNNISHTAYDVLLTKVLRSPVYIENTDEKYKNLKKKSESALVASDTSTTIKKLSISVSSLRTSWTATRRVSKDDWVEWSRRLSLELLKESPSPALRACLALAQSYPQLPRDLFNAAFVCSWNELIPAMQSDIIVILEQALMIPNLPKLTQMVLNLAEFMEHCDAGPLPLNSHVLGERAMECRAYAKALHYKEVEFRENASSEVVEDLISINNKLQQREAAEGLLQFVMRRNEDIRVQVRWYEKLNNYEKALLLYRDKLEVFPEENDALLGQMRCYEALGEWEQLFQICHDSWDLIRDENVQTVGRIATASAWNLNKWPEMAKFVECLPKESYDGSYYRAVIEISNDKYDKAQLYIDSARAILDSELTAMTAESYERAYGAMVSAQLLSELEEVIQYKLMPNKRDVLYLKWNQRLRNAQKVPTDWQRIMQLRSLVFSSFEDMKKLLKYASLCRKNGNFNSSYNIMVRLLGFDPKTCPDKHFPVELPEITLAYAKHLWMAGKKDDALKKLNTYVQDLSECPSKNCVQSSEKRTILGRCFLKLGIWKESVTGITPTSIDSILNYYNSAKNYYPDSYKVWHKFGCMHFDTLQYYKSINETIQNKTADEKLPLGAKLMSRESLTEFAVTSVEAFFRAIKLSNGKSLQDTLRLLTLWFEYGEWNAVYEAVVNGVKSIEIINWLQVIPQLIARIDSSNPLVSSLVQHILIDIGRLHPQALMYPLTVASKSSSSVRRNAANKILSILREISPNLIEQVFVVSEELIRVAILWHELWYERLEEASRLYFGERNIQGFLEILEPLHALMDRGPQTLKETDFMQTYARDLMEAHEYCIKYKNSGNLRELNEAWDIYYHVFQRISRQLPLIISLELQFVSPKLLKYNDLELAVPGSYVPNQPVIRISKVQKSLTIITSKQRPRKLSIIGSNGKEYFFLLKGHEDLRQDERVMQLFGLVNNLLLNNSSTFRRNLTIQRYAVIPLSTNSGLIGWVPNCDTLHTLIRDYREKRQILLNIEHRLMIRMAPDYDHLTLMQKVEVFEHSLEHTHGDDLAKVLWLKSPTSELWFNRRTNYTRSLAVMSMVGYILGLGDRHPSNIMLDRISGKILHIDFGDCFEVAMSREKFPERIPFRLTRMLINAMEVTGIEGTYRRTCESVMSVLQRNKDSLMSVLEAFVYDPLFNWRLLDSTQRVPSKSKLDDVDESVNEPEAGPVSENETDTIKPAPSPSAQPLLNPLEINDDDDDNGKPVDDEAVNANIGLRPLIANQEYPVSSVKQRLVNLKPEVVNKKVLAITHRVRDKLTGRDFPHEDELTVERQVELLIQKATNNENLCQCYIGWCPFW